MSMGYASTGRPIMKYAIVDPGTMIPLPTHALVISAKNAGNTLYALFALSCLNKATSRLRWHIYHTCGRIRGVVVSISKDIQ